MIRIGLTGGCCTGKSTVAEMFSRLGAEILSADEIVHRLLTEDEEIKSAVVAAFGARVLGKDASIDRDQLASIVFRDKDSLRRLTNLLYPKVRLKIRRFFEEKEREGRYEIAVAEVPLLIEGGAMELYDIIVVVKANYQSQLTRFLRRGGTKADLDRRITHHMDMAQKVKLADCVIENDGSVEETFQQVKTVYQKIRLGRGHPCSARSTHLLSGEIANKSNRKKEGRGNRPL